MGEGEPLACPSCARHYPLSERFCPHCGMPLVYVGGAEEKPITDEHERVRKIKPQYTRGELIRVAGARNQAEAELIQGILLEEGIPSMLRRTRGFDVPDFLAAGPRDVLVTESAYEVAHGLLTEEGLAESAPPPDERGYPAKLLAGVLIALALAVLLVWLLFQAAS